MSAVEQPLSTLSADADTASYANLRRLVRSGAGLGTIDPGAVRIEEMLNYFNYDYVVPADGEDFALTARAGACPWNAESELVVLGLTVGQTATEAPPTNLVLLVDVSGSMGDAEKLPLLKESMARIVKGLRAEDRVSIVTYSGVEEVVLKGLPAMMPKPSSALSTVLRRLVPPTARRGFPWPTAWPRRRTSRGS